MATLTAFLCYSAVTHVTNMESSLDCFLLLFPADVLGKVVLETSRCSIYGSKSFNTVCHCQTKTMDRREWKVEEIVWSWRKFLAWSWWWILLKKKRLTFIILEPGWAITHTVFPICYGQASFSSDFDLTPFQEQRRTAGKNRRQAVKIWPVYSLVVERWRSMYNWAKRF